MQTPYRGPSSESAKASERLPNHFTASGIVIELDHILLVHHRRIGAWLPPGGHIEEHELPHETAIRETKEETGVDICPLNLDSGSEQSPPLLPISTNENAFFLPT